MPVTISLKKAEMPSLYGADSHRKTEDQPPERVVAPRIDRAAVYLTNEVFLYRVVGLVGSGVDEMVELEDCYRLDVVRVPVRNLRECRLRVVTPAPTTG